MGVRALYSISRRANVARNKGFTEPTHLQQSYIHVSLPFQGRLKTVSPYKAAAANLKVPSDHYGQAFRALYWDPFMENNRRRSPRTLDEIRQLHALTREYWTNHGYLPIDYSVEPAIEVLNS